MRKQIRNWNLNHRPDFESSRGPVRLPPAASCRPLPPNRNDNRPLACITSKQKKRRKRSAKLHRRSDFSRVEPARCIRCIRTWIYLRDERTRLRPVPAVDRPIPRRQCKTKFLFQLSNNSSASNVSTIWNRNCRYIDVFISFFLPPTTEHTYENESPRHFVTKVKLYFSPNLRRGLKCSSASRELSIWGYSDGCFYTATLDISTFLPARSSERVKFSNNSI